MRQSNLKAVSVRLTRGALVISAISVLSLHAAAQSSDIPPALPPPIFAVTPEIGDASKAPPLPQLGGASSGKAAAIANAKPTDDSLTPAAGLLPAIVPAMAPIAPAIAPAPNASRMTGFAVPSNTTDATGKQVPAATVPVIAPAKATLASSRAAIPRLNRQIASLIAPHPLTAAYPGYDVVVCIAGCGPEPTAVSVYKPRPTQPPAQGGIIQVAMNSASSGNASECVAGCYDTASAPRSRAGVPATVPAAAPSPGSPVGATDRSVMIQTSASPPKPIAMPKAKAATPAKAAPKKPAGSEWFTRRFEKPVAN